MKRSEYFIPTLIGDPAEAQIVSHKMMLRAGMIQQMSAGIYSWLPLGFRVLQNIQSIIRKEQENAGSIEVLMPTLQSADLWRESGRYDDYGKEMLRITDRQNREMLYGPTNEEMITDIVRTHVHSYRDVPKNFWHMQWKFRDEIRPRFGLMRGREFLMKDGYSFDLTYEDAKKSYYKMFLAYLRTFAALGVRAIPMRADSGPIGGEMSHEFIILAETGESQVFCDKAWIEEEALQDAPAYSDDLEPFFKKLTGRYAATEEKHDPDAVKNLDLVSARGIEVGHIFYFGTKYSQPMKASVTHADGTERPLEMGSYGIGVSRVVAAIIEASHDDKGIIWPASVAPFLVILINLKNGDADTDALADSFYHACQEQNISVLYDDRDERAGVKFADADLIGSPWQVIVSPRNSAMKKVEIKNRANGEAHLLLVEEALAFLTHKNPVI